MTRNVETEAGKVGLRISAEKTKVMQVGGERVADPVTDGQQKDDDVDRFT